MGGIEDLTFSFGTVVQLVGLAVGGATAWVYLKKNFEANSDRIERIEKGLEKHGTEMSGAVKSLASTMDEIKTSIHETNTELVRIAGNGNVLEARIGALEARAH